MSCRFITDENGLFSCELQVSGPILEEAVGRSNAEDVLKCAVIVALSALAQDDPWPDTLLEVISTFMIEMRDELLERMLS